MHLKQNQTCDLPLDTSEPSMSVIQNYLENVLIIQMSEQEKNPLSIWPLVKADWGICRSHKPALFKGR